jgi:hypothetical protein
MGTWAYRLRQSALPRMGYTDAAGEVPKTVLAAPRQSVVRTGEMVEDYGKKRSQ